MDARGGRAAACAAPEYGEVVGLGNAGMERQAAADTEDSVMSLQLGVALRMNRAPE